MVQKARKDQQGRKQNKDLDKKSTTSIAVSFRLPTRWLRESLGQTNGSKSIYCLLHRAASMFPVSSATRALMRATRDSIAKMIVSLGPCSPCWMGKCYHLLSSPLVSPSSVLSAWLVRLGASSKAAARSAAVLRICAQRSCGDIELYSVLAGGLVGVSISRAVGCSVTLLETGETGETGESAGRPWSKEENSRSAMALSLVSILERASYSASRRVRGGPLYAGESG